MGVHTALVILLKGQLIYVIYAEMLNSMADLKHRHESAQFYNGEKYCHESAHSVWQPFPGIGIKQSYSKSNSREI